jgi:anti-sigma B factor antagonist
MLKMNISANISDTCAHIIISGMIDTHDSEKFLEQVESLPEDVQNIEFDMEQVTYISSSGLRVLLKAMDMAEERGGAMRVAKCSDFVREILNAVGFNKLFEVV